MITLNLLHATMTAMMTLEEREPFLAQALKLLPAVEDAARTASIATDGVTIIVNPEFLAQHSADERVYMLAFIALMLINDCHGRCRSRDPEIWSTACNMTTHLALLDQGMSGRPASADQLVDPELRGMTSDEVYDRLMEGRTLLLGKRVADLIAQRKFSGEQPLLVPEGAKDIPEIDFVPGPEGYRPAQLSAAFDLVKDADHWKNPIDAVVDEDMMDVLAESIPYYTGTPATFFEIDDQPGKLRVTAPGYFAGPCN